jgi:hypothetical protein
MTKKPSTEDQEKQPEKSKLDPTALVAVITLIGTVVTAVLASPVLIAWMQKTPEAKTSSPQPPSAPSVAPSAENPTPNQSQPSLDVSVTSTSASTSIQTVCITSFDNPQVALAVDANSLSFSGGTLLPLMSGQSIPFTQMRQFQVTDVITSPPPVISVTSIKMVITLLDGTTISDVLEGNGHLNGKTKFGGFGESLDKIKTVEFKEQPTC